MNCTEEVSPDCIWGKGYDPYEGMCIWYLDMGLGWRSAWTKGAWITVVLQLLMAIWTSHDVYRLTKSWLQGLHKRFFSNPLLYVQTYSCICSILMGIAWIDPLGLFGLYSLKTYLGIYPIPYAGIPTTQMIICIFMIDLLIWRAIKADMDQRPTMATVAAGIIAFISVFAGVGFTIFGWKLEQVLRKDPESTLGDKGNYLAYTMYGLVMFLSLVTGIGCDIVLSDKLNKASEKFKESIILTRGRINRWCAVNFIACAVFLGCAMHSQFRIVNKKLDPGLLTGTIVLLISNRFLELVMQANTNTMMDNAHLESGFCQHYMDIIFQRTDEVKERYQNTATAATKSKTKSNGSTGNMTDRKAASDRHNNSSNGGHTSSGGTELESIV